ncbi:MAG: restriction endonuclease subunit S, partial [Ignavibacterium sp.]|nr:restriction endonuclease subunit S [Ignavibacterium sp.]
KTVLINDCPKSIFASYLIRIRVEPHKNLDPKYLFYFMNSDIYWLQIKRIKGGRLKQGINIPNIKNLILLLPPLPEQKVIAHILQTIYEKIQKEEARKEALQKFFKSMLHHLMSGKIRVKISDEESL